MSIELTKDYGEFLQLLKNRIANVKVKNFPAEGKTTLEHRILKELIGESEK